MQDFMADLKAQRIWFHWHWEKDKDGRITKVPHSAKGGATGTTVNWAHTWVTYDEVLAIKESHNASGLGFKVPDGYFFLDADDYALDDPLMQELLQRFNSYTERSVSGGGIHIYGKCDRAKLPFITNKEGKQKLDPAYYMKNPHNRLELYIGGLTERFAVYTGDVVWAEPLKECTEAVLTTLETDMKREEIPQAKSVNAPGSYLSDDSVIIKASASKQGEKFKALWNGEIPEGKTHSEADLSLCTILAFWCGGDTEQMDRLFRSSCLMREKWERDDYRSATLEKAVNATTSFYSPITTSAADDFADTSNRLYDLDPANNKRYCGGDIGFGRLFADMYKDIARYVPERKKWYIFDGKRWVADIGGLKAMELAKELSDALIVYTASIRDETRRTAFLEVCKKWVQRRFRETYLKEAQSVYPVSMEKFDTDRYLLNCNNGTLDLRTMEFREHRPEDFFTKISKVDYIPSAKSPRFNKFIEEITSGDKEKARFLQKALGYGISGDTRFECIFFLFGELTRNGKGTLMESCLLVLGDYGRAVRPETIAQKNNTNSQSPSEDIARLAGIRFANISEPSRGLLLNAAQVKSMTGNDTMNARFLNENSFDFKPQFKMYVNTNYLPVITDMTLFQSGRVVIIPFNRHFEEWEQDRTLKEEFSKPNTQSAILNWLVEGYELLRKEGLKQPKSVIDATYAYYHESNKMAQFAEEKLEEDIEGEIRTSALYDNYRHWCGVNGFFAESNRNFINELRKMGTIERRRPKTGGEKTTLLLGYKLKNEFEDFLA